MSSTTREGTIGMGRGKALRLLMIVAIALAIAGCGRSSEDPLVAGTDVTAAPTTVAVPLTTPAPPTTTQVNYVVQSGDSLSVIASRFGVTTDELANFNAISDVNSIVVGQQLAIPPTTLAPATSTTIAG